MTPKLLTLLKFLARGWSYPTIASHMGAPLARIHFYAYRLRKATSIKNTKNAKECMDYLHGHGDSIQVHGVMVKREAGMPTQGQLRCMVLIAKGRRVCDAAAELGVSASTIRNHLWSGMKTAGVNRSHLYEYVEGLGLLKAPTATMVDPAFN